MIFRQNFSQEKSTIANSKKDFRKTSLNNIKAIVHNIPYKDLYQISRAGWFQGVVVFFLVFQPPSPFLIGCF